MGYRIEYVCAGNTLRAVVSGRSSRAHAGSIARDIAEQASRQAARLLLIDVRGLSDRVGSLGELLQRPASVARKIAVVDVREHDRYHVFAELAAGPTVRYFDDTASAIGWLHGRS